MDKINATICGYVIGICQDQTFAEDDPTRIEFIDFEPTAESGLPKTELLMFDIDTGRFWDDTKTVQYRHYWKLSISGVEKV